MKPKELPSFVVLLNAYLICNAIHFSLFDIHRLDKGLKEILQYEAQKDTLTLEEQEVRLSLINNIFSANA